MPGDSPSALGTAQGSETVLVVDDEAIVLSVTARLLARLGYRVLTANSGREAIEEYRRNRETIAAVIVDLFMPDADGAEVMAELKAIDPSVKMLLASGCTEGHAAERAKAHGLAGVVCKPYDIATLSRELRSALDRPA